ncbi:MAG: hypothetical protein Q8M70_07000 [bacterium]|nr:hypothetical protein [bacterium]
MKKFVLILSIFLVMGLLQACQKPQVVTILAPMGSPALALIHQRNNPERYAVDFVNGADPLVAAFGSKSHDVIIAPTNVGAKLYQGGIEYLFAGTITWGNFYFVSSTPKTLEELDQLTVVVFGQNQTSDIIVRYLFEEFDINVTIEYVDSVQTAQALFLADSTKIILTAEPSLSVLQSLRPNIYTIDLQDYYQQASGSTSYPQAGVFVKKSLSKQVINSVLSDLVLSIDSINELVSDASDVAVLLGYPYSKEVLLQAIPRSRLLFVSAMDSKSSLEAYFTLILGVSPQLIGGVLPNNEFYYQP